MTSTRRGFLATALGAAAFAPRATVAPADRIVKNGRLKQSVSRFKIG